MWPLGLRRVGISDRNIQRSLQANVLHDQLHRDVAAIKQSLVKDIAAAYSHNKKAVIEKSQPLMVALVAVGGEMFFVRIAIVAGRLVD